MALTLSGTNGVVGAGFTVDASGVSVTAGVGTFSSVQGSAASLTQIPAANIVGVCTSGLTKSGGGFGKILQVVQATHSSQASTTGTSFVDTGLSASITPTSNSSKILVIVTQRFFISRSTDQARGGFRLLRGSTVILQGPNQASGSEPAGEGFSSGNGPSSIQVAGAYSCSFLDSPSATSATTYKTQFANHQSSASPTIFVNATNNNTGEDGTSTMTLMEVSA